MLNSPQRESFRGGTLAGLAALSLVFACQAGCTTALSTTFLRQGLWDATEHAEEPEPAEAGAALTEQPGDASDAAPPIDTDRREAALEEAMARLSRLGKLDPAVEAALVATLQRTQPEDWPVVVEEFAASLPAAVAAAPAIESGTETADAPASPAVVIPESPEDVAAPDTETVSNDRAVTPVTEPADAGESAEPGMPAEPVTEPAEVAEQPAATPSPTPPTVQPLAVRSACFASAVRAWGDVDRFATDRFRPGQEVIVYLELDNLTAGASPAGHTTCIDTSLRLVDATGQTLHTWRFEPIAETCPTPRRDYFARYVVTIPEAVETGGCRVEMVVTDTLAGCTAAATLPVDIASGE